MVMIQFGHHELDINLIKSCDLQDTDVIVTYTNGLVFRVSYVDHSNALELYRFITASCLCNNILSESNDTSDTKVLPSIQMKTKTGNPFIRQLTQTCRIYQLDIRTSEELEQSVADAHQQIGEWWSTFEESSPKVRCQTASASCYTPDGKYYTMLIYACVYIQGETHRPLYPESTRRLLQFYMSQSVNAQLGHITDVCDTVDIGIQESIHVHHAFFYIPLMTQVNNKPLLSLVPTMHC